MLKDLKEIKIWNIKYNLLTREEIVDIVSTWIAEGRKGIHLTGANPETVALAQKDAFLREALLDSDIVNVDSYLPTRYLSKKGYPMKKRVPTPEVFEDLLQSANDNKQRVFFLGAKQETLDLLITVIERRYPDLIISGMQNGYYGKENEEKVAKQIAETTSDYLFIGMSSPLKEHFIMKYKHTINVGCLYGVGGAFDAMAGVLKRPPKYLRGFGMEYWLRVIRNPKVYAKRMPLYIQFLKLARKK